MTQREKIQNDIEKFIKSGGKITVLPPDPRLKGWKPLKSHPDPKGPPRCWK